MLCLFVLGYKTKLSELMQMSEGFRTGNKIDALCGGL